MGIFEEPRYVIKSVCNNFHEMPENTIREQTFCCGSGAGLNAGENMELRMAGGFPRANAVKHVHEAYGVKVMSMGFLVGEEAPMIWRGPGIPADIRMQEGYDHSYYFISTFIEDHLKHHYATLTG